jgi:hypothetical protein
VCAQASLARTSRSWRFQSLRDASPSEHSDWTGVRTGCDGSTKILAAASESTLAAQFMIATGKFGWSDWDKRPREEVREPVSGLSQDLS